MQKTFKQILSSTHKDLANPHFRNFMFSREDVETILAEINNLKSCIQISNLVVKELESIIERHMEHNHANG